MPFSQIEIESRFGNKDIFANVSFKKYDEQSFLIPFAVGTGVDVELLGWAVGGFYEDSYLIRSYNSSADIVSTGTLTYTIGTATYNVEVATISYA